ncbi:MAG: Mu transposase C-terminal domain-containing protein [Arsenophonus sp. NC-PE1-MAG3]
MLTYLGLRDLFIPQSKRTVTRSEIPFLNDFYYADKLSGLIRSKINNKYYIHDNSKIIMRWMDVTYLC